MWDDLKGLNIVVTGGTGTLGKAVVERLIGAGACCHVPNLVAEELSGAMFCGHPGVQVTAGVDLTDEAAVTAFYAGVPALWASVHIAGGFDMAPVCETSAAMFEHQFRMNTLTSFLSTREAVRAFRSRPAAANGGLRGGRIVNVAARPGIEPRTGAGMVAYTVAKAGVAALTQALGEELAAEAVWVNAVVPSIIDTPANRSAMPDAAHDLWPTPDEIAAAICVLLSPENRAVRGGLIPVYGRS